MFSKEEASMLFCTTKITARVGPNNVSSSILGNGFVALTDADISLVNISLSAGNLSLLFPSKNAVDLLSWRDAFSPLS